VNVTTADAGIGFPDAIVSLSKIQFCELPEPTREIALRNVGTNTLWVSLDKKRWHDVACGTSWDARVVARGFWHCTQVGRTFAVIIAIALTSSPPKSLE